MKIDKIHSDKRGEIYSVNGKPLNLDEVSFLTTSAGTARGGCIHRKNRETLVVVEGTINYYYGEELIHKTMKQGDAITIEANVPHFFLSLTDSIVLEFGCNIEEKKEKYPPFRRIVEDINNSLDN